MGYKQDLYQLNAGKRAEKAGIFLKFLKVPAFFPGILAARSYAPAYIFSVFFKLGSLIIPDFGRFPGFSEYIPTKKNTDL